MNADRRSSVAHLWAVGYDDMTRASHVKDEVVTLGWSETHLILSEAAVVVRHPDGSFTLNRERRRAADDVAGRTLTAFITGLVLAAPPLTAAAVGATLDRVGTGVAKAATVGIGEDFVREVESLMKPGTSTLFVLDEGGDMDVILHRIRGLGGTVLKTNVDVERAKLIQSTLSASRA